MLQSNLVLVTTVALVMGAGVVVGRLSDRLEVPAAPPPPPPGPVQMSAPHNRPMSWLTDQLDLTGDQLQKMDVIWAQTRQKMDKDFTGRRQSEIDRDLAIRGLLSPQQQAAYDKINHDFQAKRDQMFKDRDKLIQEANDRSRALLSEDQQKKWDILTKQMRERRGAMGPGRGPGRMDRGPGPGPDMGPPPGGTPGDGPADNRTPMTNPAASADVHRA